MQDTEMLSIIMGLDNKWRVESIKVDTPSKRIDIQVLFHKKKHKPWFMLHKSSNSAKNISVRHLPIMGMKTYLHIYYENSIDVNKLGLFTDFKYTKDMGNYILELLNTSLSKKMIARLTGLSISAIKQFIKQYESNIGGTDSLKSEYLDIACKNIQENKHLYLTNIINEEISDRQSSLDEMLNNLKREITTSEPEVAHIKTAKLLHQYFTKNQDDIKLKTNVQNIKPRDNTNAKQTPLSIIEIFQDISMNTWHDIIDSKCSIKTSNINLQRILKKINTSLENDHSKYKRESAILILQQFFIINRKYLHDEIQQLSNKKETINSIENNIPPENALCWQKLIDGELLLDNSSEALRVMLQNIRIIVENNNNARSDSIKNLRKYFIQNANRYKEELKLLTAA